MGTVAVTLSRRRTLVRDRWLSRRQESPTGPRGIRSGEKLGEHKLRGLGANYRRAKKCNVIVCTTAKKLSENKDVYRFCADFRNEKKRNFSPPRVGPLGGGSPVWRAMTLPYG